jgi:maltose alpha-D-glucosyltransferase/alpha-amylase
LADGGGFRGRTPGMIRPEDVSRLRHWSAFWHRCATAAFLEAYLEVIHASALLPTTIDQSKELLSIFILERTLQELAYELSQRPAWAPIPLRGLARMLEL